jgi:hypothetical protein
MNAVVSGAIPISPTVAVNLTADVPAEAEVFPVFTLPPHADLAAQARLAPLIDAALRLAQWCAPGRQVTAKGVLKPAAAREAVEELRLWQRDDTLTDPSTRADTLAGLRSAGDLPVLDNPWQFASENGLVALRSGRAYPGPELPDPDDADRLVPTAEDDGQHDERRPGPAASTVYLSC